MRIPAYWAKGTANETAPDGAARSFSCWRSSDASQSEAQESALAAAARILRARLSGQRLDRYGYGNVPLREEVIQRFTSSDGEITAAVTRNAYGALVLNTARVMFVDIDFQEVGAGATLSQMFGALLGRKPPSPVAPIEQQEQTARLRVENFVRDNPAWNVRVYRTHSGLRLLATHDLFDPTGDETQACFVALGADPLYTRLCQAQASFRARLTPKPWRCGIWKPAVSWPRDTGAAQARFDAWQAKYSASQAKYATCRHLATLGNATMHPDAEVIVKVHDHIARCDAALPLA
ncbi:MAG TPA: hypothetical protein VGG64_00090 [Pirellulales bacterium]|jgi:hypothetical protein